ncbi:MAG: exodeoxyribonuclease VII large subunit [Rubrivivax sp.]
MPTPPQAAPRLDLLRPGGAGPGIQAWGVAALLLATADALASRFGAVAVRGEIAGFMRASSGHCYFTLKDADGAPALLRCAMFRRHAVLSNVQPSDGIQVEVRGRLAVYEARGELQMVVESLERLGAGGLYEEFLRLRARLEAQGLFDAARKRPIAAHPRRLAVVTSAAAAAWRDVMAVLARRSPHVQAVLVPSLVQGAEAPAQLVDALARAAALPGVDTVLLVRGGGALEDLWAFNDERVVRAIVASPLPVVCGVGHESDVTLADLAADLRAATPTAAAELAAPSRDQLALDGEQRQRRLQQAVQRQWQRHEQRLDRIALLLGQRAQVLLALQGRLDLLEQRLRRALTQRLERETQRQDAAAQRLGALDPRQVLHRGFTWVEDADGGPIGSVHRVRPGQAVRTVWSDGTATARIESTQPASP